MSRLGLTACLSLTPEPLVVPEPLDQSGVTLRRFPQTTKLLHVRVTGEKELDEDAWVALLPSLLLQVLFVRELQPLYVHCLDGRAITALVVAAYRVTRSRWPLRSAMEEAGRTAGSLSDQDAIKSILDRIQMSRLVRAHNLLSMPASTIDDAEQRDTATATTTATASATASASATATSSSSSRRGTVTGSSADPRTSAQGAESVAATTAVAVAIAGADAALSLADLTSGDPDDHIEGVGTSAEAAAASHVFLDVFT